MTEETYLCESCGHLSPSRERCTRCGRDLQAPAIGLYGTVWAMDKLHELLAGRGTLEFKELPEDQIPRRPKLPPRFLRKPTVPRRKR